MSEEDKKHREVITDQPGMISVVTKEYLVWPFTDVVIHKKFFQFWTLFAFIGTSLLWIIGIFTDWYWQLAIAFGMLFLRQLWLGPSIVAVIIIVIYIFKGKRKGGAKKRKPQSPQ